MSDYAHPLPAAMEKRRSTGTSDALQYYWSESAGERSASFSSSLGMSPLDSSPRTGIPGSPYTLSPHPVLHEAKSSLSLRELVQQEAQQHHHHGHHHHPLGRDPPIILEQGDLLPYNTPRNPDTASAAGPSNRRIHLVSYSNDSMSAIASQPSVPSSLHDMTPPSPSSSHSAESEYSLVEDDPIAAPPPRRRRLPTPPTMRRVSPQHHAHRQGMVDPDRNLAVLPDRNLGVMLDPTFDEWAHQRAFDPPAPQPSGPISPPLMSPAEIWSTPTQAEFERPGPHMTPGGWSARSSPHPEQDRTPRNSVPISINPPRADMKIDASQVLTPKSGRLLFVAPPDVSRRSLDDLQRDIAGLGLDSPRGARGARVGLSVNSSAPMSLDEPDTPHSAPAHKTTFDTSLINGNRGRVRPTSLLPPPTTPLGSSQDTFSNHRVPSRTASPISIRRSPEPPPKSELRRATPTPPPPIQTTVIDAIIASPTKAAAQPTTPPLPTIINTPHTPEPPNRAGTAPVPSSARSPGDRRARSTSPPPMGKSNTIQDLTNILGGAIDEIGLVDSRDVPPPTVGEPLKPRSSSKPLQLHSLPPRSTSSQNSTPASVTPASHDPASLSPTMPMFTPPAHNRAPGSQGSIGMSFTSSPAMQGSGRSNVSRHVRKASSILSLRSSNYSAVGSPTIPTFSATGSMTLPSAVLFGNIKALKTSGERARAYSRSLQELARAESGLREMCINIQKGSGHPLSRSKQGMGQLGIGAPSGMGGQMGLGPPAPRNVSAGSEFPMRPDAYSAREIAVRTLEPADDPSALPPNLPYPALQLSASGIKPSGSMQSVASTTSSRRPGFLSAFGRLKKDKENTSLGPPTGSLQIVKEPPPSAMRRDTRSSTGSRRNSEELPDASPGVRVQPSMATPRGPRGPDNLSTMRSSLDTPPPRPLIGHQARSSLEAPRRPLMTHQPGRASLDSSASAGSPSRLGLSGPRPINANLTPSPLARQDALQPNEEEVRQFSDLIPQAERAVARVYLQRYGEMSFAMTAYLEDEKKGTLMRA